MKLCCKENSGQESCCPTQNKLCLPESCCMSGKAEQCEEEQSEKSEKNPKIDEELVKRVFSKLNKDNPNDWLNCCSILIQENNDQSKSPRMTRVTSITDGFENIQKFMEKSDPEDASKKSKKEKKRSISSDESKVQENTQ